jgi:hypothetical protein
MRRSAFASIMLALCLVGSPGLPLAQDLTSPLLEQLRAEAAQLRREASALGNSDTMVGAHNNLHTQMFVHDERNRRIDRAIEFANGTTAELDAYRTSEEARRIFTRDNAYNEIHQDYWEFMLEGIAVAAGWTTAAAVGPARPCSQILWCL